MLELGKRQLLPVLESSDGGSKKAEMAIYHFAYTFNSDDFHRDLKARIIKEGEIDVYKLQQEARSLVLNASDKMKQILDDLRYDDEWLDDPDGDASQSSRWYLINLVSVFDHCPSLSNNRFYLSHYVLEKVLPVAGWNKGEITEPIHGKYLSTLLESTEYEAFLNEFILLGGCLSNKDIVSVHTHLKSSREYFTAQSPVVMESIKAITDRIALNPDDILNAAYEDAIEMLETATKRNESLYLLRDT